MADRFEHRESHLVSERFLDLGDPAELGSGHPPGFGGRRSGTDVLSSEEVEMHLDLPVRLLRKPVAHEQIPQTRDERDDGSPDAHESGDSRRRRAMTSAMRSQSSVWAASRRRPAPVMA